VQQFHAAMQDDFNTSLALSVLFELAREINRQRDSNPAAASYQAAVLRQLAGLLGLLERDPEAYLRGGPVASGLSDEQIEALIAKRTEARQNRDWGLSDQIRDELQSQAIVLEDGPTGTTWRRE
jgi:cysteinyl-tRNA synthetase